MSDDTTTTFSAAIGKFADVVLHRTGKAPTIAIGPVVCGVDDGHDTKHRYFVVCSGDAQGKFRVDQFKIAWDDVTMAEQCRAMLMMEFVSRRPVVMHDFDDELQLTRFCEQVWPCDKTRRIRGSTEREREEWKREKANG